jgi:hypothetical protein
MAQKRRASSGLHQQDTKRKKTEAAGAASILYRPLRGSQFRLLNILSGSGRQRIACRPNGYNIDAAPAYEALSYAWGSPENPLKIDVNGKAFTVTRNLNAALRRLRSPDKNRLVWVDAICINQKDTDERSHQVQRMAQIYSNAEQVIVWLGDEIGKTKARLALQAIEAISNACKELAWLRSTSVWTLIGPDFRERTSEDVMRRLSADRSCSRVVAAEHWWDALCCFYMAAWFLRLRCFQEVFLARKSAILVHDFSTTPSAIGACTLWLIAWRHVNDQSPVSQIWRRSGKTELGIWSCYDRFCYRQRWAKSSRIFDGSLLQKMLQQNRPMEASDDKDRVYALLDVCQRFASRAEQGLPILVDYRKSVTEVYVDAAWACIIMSGTLDVLGHTSDWKGSPPYLDHPSWVARWDQPFSSPLDPCVPSQWKASGDKVSRLILPRRFNFEGELGGHELPVQGLVLGEVTSRGRCCGFQLRTTPGCLVEFWNAALSNYSLPIALDHALDQIPPLIARMAKTWIGGWYRLKDVLVHHLNKDSTAQLCAEFLSLVDEACMLSNGSFAAIAPRDIAAFFPEITDFHNQDLKMDSHSAYWAVGGRRIAWLSCKLQHKFDFALAPPDTKVGDVVTVLYGASMPYILRQHNGGWLHVGPCYLEGVMCSELFEKQANGRTLAEEYNEQEFVIH